MQQSRDGKFRGWILALQVISFWKALQVNAANTCNPIDQCTCQTEDGKYISLWDIDNRFITTDTLSRSFSYSYSPCTSFTTGNTECKDVLACQSDVPPTTSFAMAFKPHYVSTSYDTQTGMFKFLYTGSSSTECGNGIRTTTILLKCDESATVPNLDTFLESPPCAYTSTLTSKCACPGGCKHEKNRSKTSGLSTGSILCIVLLVLTLFYLIGGILIYKFALHKEQWEVIPHKDFWKDFPVLVKDGFVYTYGKIKGSKGEYQQIS